MNRKSPASRVNPAPTGAVCAFTVWENHGAIGPPVDTSMAIVVAIDHAFLARTPRQLMLNIRIPLSHAWPFSPHFQMWKLLRGKDERGSATDSLRGG